MSIKAKKFIFDWVTPIIGALILALLINKFILFKASIPSESMEPELMVGDQVFVTRIYNTNNIKREDIVVFKSKELGKTLIKRVIGIPGDHIEIKSGVVYVNGKKISEPYVKYPDEIGGTYDVPKGKFFFLGDNRAVSYDARKWNNPYIDKSDIEGKARLRVYPFSRFGFVK